MWFNVRTVVDGVPRNTHSDMVTWVCMRTGVIRSSAEEQLRHDISSKERASQ